MNIRKLALGPISSLCLLAGCATLWCAPVLAKEVHIYKTTFGSEGSGPGQLKEPQGIAVNDTTHEVYVVDTGNNRVERFAPNAATGTYEYMGQFNGSAAPTGVFSTPTEIAIDNSSDPGLDPSAGDVYVVDSGHGVVDKFSAAGTYEGQLTGTPITTNARGETYGGSFVPGDEAKPENLQGIAVDPTGSLLVSTNAVIYTFSNASINQDSAAYKTPFGGGPLAVDAEEDLYIDPGGAQVVKLNSSAETLSAPFGQDTEAWRVAVDPVGQEAYLDNGRENNGAGKSTITAFTLSGTPIETFGLGHINGPDGVAASDGIAVDAGDGAVYATDRADQVVSFEAITLPTVSLMAASERSPRTVTLQGSVNPEAKPVKSCVFEYDTREYKEGEAAHGTSMPCSPSATALGEGAAAVQVSARLEGLTPQTQYYYRLVAQNAAPVTSQSMGEFFTGPRLGSESVSDVAATSATVQDSIDPDGAATEYRLEYGASTAYEHSVSGTAGAGLSAVPVDVHLQELQAGVVYHYRVVAIQDGESVAEPDRTFMTQNVGGDVVLPDSRVWELVSPPDKDGALIEPFEETGQIQAASDGSGIAYRTEGPAVGEDSVGDTEHSQVLSRRGADGWSTVDLTLPGRLPENGAPAEALDNYKPEYQLFSPDLSLAVVEPKPVGTPLLSPEATERTLYLRDNLKASFLPLVTPTNLPEEAKIEEKSAENGSLAEAFRMHFVAATPDLGHVVLKTPAALTPEAIDEETIHQHGEPIQQNFYEWSDGQLQLINILPDGQEAHGLSNKEPLVEFAGTSRGGYGGAQRALSTDGRRVAWNWGEYLDSNYKGLYVRDMVEEKTVRVGGAHAIYQTMNSEGSKIFYLEDGDLYVYDFESETATDLTASHGPGESSGGVRQAVSDVSEDGSYVYFVATGVLAEGGVSGQYNLYLLHDTDAGWTTTYIASLAAQDRPTWYTGAFFGDGMDLSRVSSRVSPDGRYLAFMSSRPLTGYDNTDAVSGKPDEEVYLYDAQENRLVCASCDPTSARPVGVFDSKNTQLLVDGNSTWAGLGGEGAEGGEGEPHWLAASVPGYDPVDTLFTYQPRYLSDSGRLFFNSPVGLVPQDTNGLEDVYEYEPEGVGNCSSSLSSVMQVYVKEVAGHPVGGCVGLISSGTSSAESVFYDAGETGDDVFFDTKSRLVGEDYDNSYDVYDAHVCSSEVPCVVVPVSPPPCNSGDSCKAAPSPQPAIFGAPASATFSGAGNVAPSSTTSASRRTTKTVECERGRKLGHGKCVKRKKKAQTKKAKKAGNHRRVRS